jgi:hypothetical protein
MFNFLIVMYVSFFVFYVLFVCKCEPYCCHRVSTQLRLNIHVYIYICVCVCVCMYMYSAYGPVWQEPEPSQATGMALVRCALGKFIGVGCHYFPLPLDILTFAARCSHVPINASAPSCERWNYRTRNGRLILPITCDFHGKL